MRFDKINVIECVAPVPTVALPGDNPPPEQVDPCLNAASGSTDDERCSDPNFAQTNPGLCLTSPRIIVRPGVAFLEVNGSITFKAYLYIGGEEEEITDNLTWSASNSNLVIGSGSGSATGAVVGSVMVSAQHGNISGFAQVNVVGSCGQMQNGLFLVFDDSQSSGLSFSGTYSTRMNFAKNVADSLLGNINFDSDVAAVIAHDASGVIKSELISDLATLRLKVSEIGTSPNKTSLMSGLQKALDAADTFDGRKIAILFTDGGENKEKASDLVQFANQMKADGWIIMAVGLRATGRDFRLLEAIVTPGYLINGGPGNQSRVVSWLTGFKAYCCSACTAGTTVTLPTPELNYDDFVKWDVLGYVDLIGTAAGGNSLFDLLPGNGLYVDLAGSGSDLIPLLGSLQSKDPFIWTLGNNYRLTFKLAGNQRVDRAGDIVQAVIYGSAGAFKTETITIDDYLQDFTTYTVDFTPGGADDGAPGGKIVIGQTQMQTVDGGGGSQVLYGTVGCLLKDVFLQNLTTGETLLSDNFSGENPTEVTPTCNDPAFFDCPAQIPDMAPLPDIECNTVQGDTVFSSTQSYTAECPSGTTGDDVTKSATATSLISQADADAKALAAATADANAALECVVEVAAGTLINLHFLDYAVNPLYSKQGVGADALGGYALALGGIVVGASDYWNEENKDGFGFNNGSPVRRWDGLKLADVAVAIDQSWSALGVSGASDNIYGVPAKFAASGKVIITGLPLGNYHVAVYGHGLTAGDKAYVGAGSHDSLSCTLGGGGGAGASVIGQDLGAHPLDDAWKTASGSTFIVDDTYAFFSVDVRANGIDPCSGNIMVIYVMAGALGNCNIAAIQIVKT